MVRDGRDDWLQPEAGWLGAPARRQPEVRPEPVEAGDGDPEKLPVVLYVPVLCPHCRSRDVLVTGTRAGESVVRYHECRTCGGRFRSLERIPRR